MYLDYFTAIKNIKKCKLPIYIIIGKEAFLIKNIIDLIKNNININHSYKSFVITNVKDIVDQRNILSSYTLFSETYTLTKIFFNTYLNLDKQTASILFDKISLVNIYILIFKDISSYNKNKKFLFFLNTRNSIKLKIMKLNFIETIKIIDNELSKKKIILDRKSINYLYDIAYNNLIYAMQIIKFKQLNYITNRENIYYYTNDEIILQNLINSLNKKDLLTSIKIINDLVDKNLSNKVLWIIIQKLKSLTEENTDKKNNKIYTSVLDLCIKIDFSIKGVKILNLKTLFYEILMLLNLIL